MESLVPKRGRPVSFPASRIVWKNREKLADVCGCLFGCAGREGCGRVVVNESGKR